MLHATRVTSAAARKTKVVEVREARFRMASHSSRGVGVVILAFKNTLDWLAMDDDLAKCALPVASDKGDGRKRER